MADLHLDVQSYDVQAGSYFWRAEENLRQMKSDPSPRWLFYAAFEYRCCIEQLLRYYLELIGVTWSKKLWKLYTGSDLKKAILKQEPEFYDKIRFTDVLIRALGRKGVYDLDLDLLSSHHGWLGNYLHSQVKPTETVDDPAWWSRFWEVVEAVRSNLYQIQSQDIAHITLEDQGWALYDAWKSGDMTDEEVQSEFLKGILPHDSA